jgi:transcriptional regulator with XRE-family HTH domain
MTIGECIRNNRRSKNLTQAQIEHITGIKREYLSQYETGKHKNPTVDTLYKMVTDGTGVKLSDFFRSMEVDNNV